MANKIKHIQLLNTIYFTNPYSCVESTFSVCNPLNVGTGTYVTSVNSLFAESSSSLRLRESRTLILNGTFLQKKTIISIDVHGLYL